MVRIFDDLQSLSHAAEQMICDEARKSISEKGSFSLVLSGGETPRTTYRLLSENSFRELIDWKNVRVFFADERYVPHDHERSNFKMVNDELLNRVPIPAENIFPIPTDSSPEKDALNYEASLKKIFTNPFPEFDLTLLGLGENGHTASLFPFTYVLNEKSRWVKEVFVAEEKEVRITLTAPAINSSKQIVFLVSGRNKSEILQTVLDGERNPEKFPAQLIRDSAIWMIDRAAGRLL